MHRRDWIRTTAAAGLGMVASRFPRLDDGQAENTALALTARLAPWTVWPGLPTTLMTFGGVYPSPTYRVQRGDTFDLTLTNQLSEDTNIHWHGLNVPASMDGHPLDVVGTGGSRQYLFDVIDRAGTYWYHPHPDMRTGPQVWGGMAGVFIIDDPAEQSLGLPSGPFDVAIMLQDRRTADGSFSYTPGPSDLMDGYLGDTVLANGVPDAQITVAAATYRFRLLNLSNGRIFRVAFEDGRPFQVIAGDGGLLEHPLPATEVFLAPAERVEIVVDFSPRESRSVRLVSRPFTSGGMLAAGGVPQGTFLPLLRFRISGSGPVTTVPANLVPLAPLGPAEITRRFTMDMILPPAHGNFRINGLPYDINRVDTLIERGVVEHWEIWNTSAHPHPFHVHATQFRVLARSSGPLRVHERGLKDTVLVWPGEAVKIAILFDRYPGLFLLHCHNLEHEDAGMMSNFEVR